MQRHWHALRVQPGLQLVHTHRTVEVMRHVVFTRPQQLDRPSHGFGDLRRLHDEIKLNPAAKTTAQERRFQIDVFRLEAQRRGHCALRTLLKLRRANQLAFAARKAGRKVHRLQRRMRLHLGHILGLHGFGSALHGGTHVACRFANGKNLAAGECRAGSRQHRVVVQRSARAFVPLHHHGFACFLRLPVAVGDHGHAVIDLHHVNHAWHAFGGCGVKALDLAANHGALLQAGIDHARQLHVNAKLGGAVDLGGRVEPLHARAHNSEVFRVFQGHFFGHGQFGCRLGQLPIGGFFAISAHDHAVVGFEGAAVNIPFLRSGADEHFAHLGTAQAQLFPTIAHRGRTPGDLRTQQGVGVNRTGGRNRHLDAGDIDVEFLCNQHGHGGVDALPHLGPRRNQGDGVVVGNVYPGIGRVHGASGQRLADGAGQGKAHDQARGGNGRGLEKIAA